MHFVQHCFFYNNTPPLLLPLPMQHFPTHFKAFVVVCLLLTYGHFAHATHGLTPTFSPPTDSLRADSLRGRTLDEAKVTGTRLLLVTKKDTTIYDLDALTLQNSALLRDAFEKLPGISFRNGTLYHNGQEVKRVLVNGMDFSSQNPLLALQTLPSYIMKNVKVYERKSDFALRTGMDDGREELVADVSVRRRYMGTWTGEVQLGGGTDERFRAKGFANTFTPQHRISLFGNANNVNEQLWYNGDGKERAGEAQTGDNHFYTPGATFFWKNKHSQQQKGYFKIEGNFDYNHELHHRSQRQHAEHYLTDGSLFAASNAQAHTNTDRWAGHLKTDWNISDHLTLNYTAALSVNSRRSNNNTLQAHWNANPLPNGGVITDSITALLATGAHHPTATNLLQTSQAQENDGTMFHQQIDANYKLPQQKLYLRLTHAWEVSTDEREGYNATDYKYFNAAAAQSHTLHRWLDQRGHSHKQSLYASVMKYFNVAEFKRLALHFDYRYEWQHANNDEQGWLSTQPLLRPAPNLLPETIDNETTRHRKEVRHHHSLQLGLSAAKGVFNLELKPTLHLQHETLHYAKRTLPLLSPQRDYRYIGFESTFRMRSAKTGNLLARYHISPSLPSLLTMVDYPDRADPQHIIEGNPTLRMGTTHTAVAWYSRQFTQQHPRGTLTRTLSAHLAFASKHNDITLFSTYDRQTGVVSVKPFNVSGNWEAKANIGFSTPLDVAQRWWVEALVETALHRTKTYSGTVADQHATPQLNDNRLSLYSATLKPRLRLKRADLALAYQLTRENNQSTYASANNKAQWQHLLTGTLDCQLPFQWQLNVRLNYHNYASYITQERADWLMLHFAIERAFLKKKNLFASLSLHDVFDQNKGFVQQYSATALTQTHQQTLGRYAMLTLKYRFSSKP